ncbi:DUF1398 domain-containing protein [Sphingobacterium lactis]|uniref:DUF1398 domain-containing protein n=1 Tax=Sphingobacterium lactis TaxID=797291 RepID=UPI003EC50556
MSFTYRQIEEAHAKVKTGADFPAYIQEIRELGVTGFEFHVKDGNEKYIGEGGYEVYSHAKYPPVEIAEEVDLPTFAKALVDHQEGRTDFPQFLVDCASTGVHYWHVDLQKGTCTYFDGKGEEILEEEVKG